MARAALSLPVQSNSIPIFCCMGCDGIVRGISSYCPNCQNDPYYGQTHFRDPNLDLLADHPDHPGFGPYIEPLRERVNLSPRGALARAFS